MPKREVSTLDGTPHKRMFWSIINDYGFQTAVTELIDNCIDIWVSSGRLFQLKVEVDLDPERQLICISDNAGGVRREHLDLLIAPGGSNNSPDASTIGIFGVGSKRAVVALAEVINIRTRVADETYQVDITNAWLQSEDWHLPFYEVEPIDRGTTIIEFSHLRRPIREEDLDSLRQHIGEVYATYLLSSDVSIMVNKVACEPIAFTKWAYPEGYAPNITMFEVEPAPDESVIVEIEAGLITDRNPITENYGVYIYCNDRLVVKELRTKDVGYFVSSEAGTPHPDASLCRVIVRFAGPAKWMPWNSSKTNITPHHPIFEGASPLIIRLTSHFSKLSRALKNTWPETVFPFADGEVSQIDADQALTPRKLVLPPIPKTRHSRADNLKAKNRNVIARQPYVTGLLEAMVAVDLIIRQKFETGNRIALILLDSTFEIALKEFLVHNKGLFGNIDIQKVKENRPDVVYHVNRVRPVDADIIELGEHYYLQRNQLIHERATLQIPDEDVKRYREVVERLLTTLYYVLW